MPISKPTVSITLSPANQSISTGNQRVLIVGGMKTGTATSGALQQDVGNANEWDALFGANSMLAAMIRAFRKINKITRVDAIGLTDNGSGVAATGTVAFTGPASATGTLYFTVGSYYNNRYELAVTSGQSATTIGANLAALINADTKCPYTANNSTGTVTLTAVHAGTEGNAGNLRYEGSVAGVGITLTAFASGATNPTLTSIFDVVADTRYQTVVWPTTWATTEPLNNFLDTRWNVNNDVLDGVLIHTLVDSKADHKTFANAINKLTYVPMAAKEVVDANWKGNSWQTQPYEVSAIVAALRSLRLTAGANIASYITTTTGALDTVGGPALASLPYFNTPVNDIPTIPVGKDWSMSEVAELEAAGISVLGNNRVGTGVVLGDLVTTYKTDAAGNTDVTFKYLNNVDVASTVREYFFLNLKRQYTQSRLTNGDLVPGRSMANAKSIGGYSDQLYSELSGTDYVLLQAGEEAKNFFKNNRTVTLDLSTGSVTMQAKTPIVTQLRNIIFPMQIAFSLV